MIEVQGLEKSYDKLLFRNATMRFEDGEVVLISGENGSGKSTFLRILVGLVEADAGHFHIDGELLYQPQDAMLFDMTAYENAIVGNKKADPKRVRELFRELGIEELIDRRVKGFSGGERQKTMLIRSLVTGGDALLFDEPFSALDNKSMQVCLRLMQEYAREHHVPLAFVSHDILSAEKIADHRFHLEEQTFSQIF